MEKNRSDRKRLRIAEPMVSEEPADQPRVLLPPEECPGRPFYLFSGPELEEE